MIPIPQFYFSKVLHNHRFCREEMLGLSRQCQVFYVNDAENPSIFHLTYNIRHLLQQSFLEYSKAK